MSHFTVLVIGPDPEKQLAPYHEFECTGRDDEYVVDVDVTEELRAEYAKRTELKTLAEWVEDYHGKKRRKPGEPTSEEFKFGYAQLDERGEVVKVVRRTNPNARWDWYLVGGRWTGFFKLRPGAFGALGRPGTATDAAKPGRADQALKSAIDFDGMRDEEERSARQLWRKVKAIIGDLPWWDSWETVTARFTIDGTTDYDAARSAYHAQPAKVKIAKERDSDLFFLEDDVATDEESYVKLRRDRAVAPYALVQDGKWLERGEMGWWGISRNETDREVWTRKFNELLDALPDDALLTLVDCHI